jgi:flagellar motor protein MotB
MGFRISFLKKQDRDECNPYWMSFSDIMAGLLILFILATLIFMQKTEKERKSAKELKQSVYSYIIKNDDIRKNIIEEIKDSLQKYGLNVITTDDTVRIQIKDLHFESNKYKIPKNKEKNAILIGQVLYDTIKKDNRYKEIDTIFIEGHTDKIPTKKYKQGNWQLSSQRAIALWEIWGKYDFGKKMKILRNKGDSYLFSVSGYADTRPVSKILKENRRIDIRFSMKKPNSNDLLKKFHIDLNKNEK